MKKDIPLDKKIVDQCQGTIKSLCIGLHDLDL